MADFLGRNGQLSLTAKEPSQLDSTRKTFVAATLNPALNAEKIEIKTAEAQYGSDFATFRLKGNDQTDALRGLGGLPRHLGTGALAALGDTDVPSLNAVNTYTELGYRLQNPLLRGGEAAFRIALRDTPELQVYRTAIARGDYSADALLAETKRHNEMTKLGLEKLPLFVGDCYRGTNNEAASRSRQGSTLTDLAFASYTESPDVAFGYIKTDEPYAVMYKVRSKTGRAIKESVNYGAGGGREVLFMPGTKFIVTAPPETKKDGQYTYTLVTVSEV